MYSCRNVLCDQKHKITEKFGHGQEYAKFWVKNKPIFISLVSKVFYYVDGKPTDIWYTHIVKFNFCSNYSGPLFM